MAGGTFCFGTVVIRLAQKLLVLHQIKLIASVLKLCKLIKESRVAMQVCYCASFYGMSHCLPVSLCRGCIGSNQRGRHALGLASPKTQSLYLVQSCINAMSGVKVEWN